MSDEQKELAIAAGPLMKYLAEKHHPHTVCIVDAGKAEVLQGVRVVITDEFIVD